MLKLELQESAAVAFAFTAVAFTARMGLPPLHLHTCLTPWSVFQDGSCRRATSDNLQQAGQRHSRSQWNSKKSEVMSDKNDLGFKPTVYASTKGLTKVRTITVVEWSRKLLGSRPLASPLTISGLLTLLSKCFSTFPQGTCLLSISRQYLAMDGGYHPFCALLPKSVTQSTNTVRKL